MAGTLRITEIYGEYRKVTQCEKCRAWFTQRPSDDFKLCKYCGNRGRCRRCEACGIQYKSGRTDFGAGGNANAERLLCPACYDEHRQEHQAEYQRRRRNSDSR